MNLQFTYFSLSLTRLVSRRQVGPPLPPPVLPTRTYSDSYSSSYS